VLRPDTGPVIDGLARWPMGDVGDAGEPAEGSGKCVGGDGNASREASFLTVTESNWDWSSAARDGCSPENEGRRDLSGVIAVSCGRVGVGLAKSKEPWSSAGVSMPRREASSLPKLALTAREGEASLRSSVLEVGREFGRLVWPGFGVGARSASEPPGRSGGRGPVHPPSHRARHSPIRPTVGANLRTFSHARSHSASAMRAKHAATLDVVEEWRWVTKSAWLLHERQHSTDGPKRRWYYLSWFISGPRAPRRARYRECSSVASRAFFLAFFS
jgi:hypothetical protein